MTTQEIGHAAPAGPQIGRINPFRLFP